MPDEDLDLSSDWDLLRPSDPKPKEPKYYDLDSIRADIERKAIDHVLLACDKIPGPSKQNLQLIVERSVKYAMHEWTKTLDEQGTEGLIEFFLLGSSLSEEELSGLLRAIPETLLHRILASSTKSATGIHALISLEWHRRNGASALNYRIDQQGQVVFQDPTHGEIGFFLDDRFKDE